MSDKKITSNGYAMHKPEFKAPTKEYKKNFFYYRKRMQAKFIDTLEALLPYINSTYGPNAVESMKRNKVVIYEFPTPLAVYATQEEVDKAFKNLNDKEDWQDEQKAYNKLKRELKVDLAKVSSLLWSHCHLTMKNWIKSDAGTPNTNKQQRSAIPINSGNKRWKFHCA